PRAGCVERLDGDDRGRFLAVGSDHEGLVAGSEEDFAFWIDRGRVDTRVFGYGELPLFAGSEDLGQYLILALAGFHALGPVFPEIAHRIWEDRGGLFSGVSAVAPDVLDFIAG